jgi:hypothetical protein
MNSLTVAHSFRNRVPELNGVALCGTVRRNVCFDLVTDKLKGTRMMRVYRMNYAEVTTIVVSWRRSTSRRF